MKKGKFLKIAFLAVVMVLSFLGTETVKAADRIAYIDLGKVFDEYNKAKDFDKLLEEEKEDKQQQREKMVKTIRKLKDELELTSKKAKEKKQTEIDRKIKELQDYDREVNTKLREKYDSMVREILKEINATIEEYGQKEKYDAIFDDRVILYSNDSINITSQILKILNGKYQGKY